MTGSPDYPQTPPSFEFSSPEVLLRQKCSVFSDVWSVGVLIYLLLRYLDNPCRIVTPYLPAMYVISGCLIFSGTFPFYNESFEKMTANIINCHYRFGLETFKGISYEAKELIKQLLHSDPTQRASATECIQSSWARQVMYFCLRIN